MKNNYENISITLVSDFNNDILGSENLIYSIWKNSDIRILNILTTFNNIKNCDLYKLAVFLGFKINIFQINDNFYKAEGDIFFESLKHISKTAFSKILILKYIEENTLYLDTDTLIVGKLKSKKLSKLSDHPIFVVKNGYHSPEYWFKSYENIFSSIDEVSEKAFNSGVIYFNKPKKQVYNFEKLLDSIKKNRFVYMDQAHFNYVYKQNAGYLPIKFNFPVHSYLNKNVIKSKKNIILHFASKNKPWINNENEVNPYFSVWKKYNDKKNKIKLRWLKSE